MYPRREILLVAALLHLPAYWSSAEAFDPRSTNLYERIGASPSAGMDELLKNYQTAIRQTPDPELKKKLAEAASVLFDDELRKKYDARLADPHPRESIAKKDIAKIIEMAKTRGEVPFIQEVNPEHNFYRLLGVHYNATAGQIRAAFESKAKNAPPEEKSTLEKAARILLHPSTRMSYDSRLALGFKNKTGGTTADQDIAQFSQEAQLIEDRSNLEALLDHLLVKGVSLAEFARRTAPLAHAADMKSKTLRTAIRMMEEKLDSERVGIETLQDLETVVSVLNQLETLASQSKSKPSVVLQETTDLTRKRLERFAKKHFVDADQQQKAMELVRIKTPSLSATRSAVATAISPLKQNTFYALLGVSPNASANEIWDAYLEKVQENKHDPARLATLSEGVGILTDPTWRKRYDSGLRSKYQDQVISQYRSDLESLHSPHPSIDTYDLHAFLKAPSNLQENKLHAYYAAALKDPNREHEKDKIEAAYETLTNPILRKKYAAIIHSRHVPAVEKRRALAELLEEAELRLQQERPSNWPKEFNPYRILGIPEYTPQEDIEIAFQHALETQAPSEKEKIIQAWWILRNDKHRAAFDKHLKVSDLTPQTMKILFDSAAATSRALFEKSRKSPPPEPPCGFDGLAR